MTFTVAQFGIDLMYCIFLSFAKSLPSWRTISLLWLCVCIRLREEVKDIQGISIPSGVASKRLAFRAGCGLHKRNCWFAFEVEGIHFFIHKCKFMYKKMRKPCW